VIIFLNFVLNIDHDLQQLVHDEMKHDGIINATQQQLNNTIKQNFNNTDINGKSTMELTKPFIRLILGSKVVRLVRAKQATKRKSSLDTLIEVVQKELLRVNGQTNPIAPSSKLQNRIFQSTSSPHRSIISSHPTSLASQSNHTFKIANKRGIINLNNSKTFLSLQQRNKSFNNDDNDFIGNDDIEDIQSGPENIEEIVRDTVDKLVAITLLNTAPFIVNMLTAIPGNGHSTNTESKVLTNVSRGQCFAKYSSDTNRIKHRAVQRNSSRMYVSE
jgi:hypothetical protein